MEEDGLYLRIGRRVANFAPGLARIALAMPAVFTRWVQGRLFNKNTIIGVFLVGLLTLAVGLPIAGLNELYLHGPSNKEIFNFSSAWWISLLKWMGQNNEFDLLWVGFCGILVVAIIPWVLKFYLWVVFSSLGFVIWWLIFLTTGYDLTTIVDPGKAEQPITPKDSSDSAKGLAAPQFPQTQAVAERDSASLGQDAGEIHLTESFLVASPSVNKADTLLEGNSENPLVPQLCLELLKVERNFVLRRGESAVEPRENKESVADGIDWKQTTNAIKALTEILEKKFS